MTDAEIARLRRLWDRPRRKDGCFAKRDSKRDFDRLRIFVDTLEFNAHCAGRDDAYAAVRYADQQRKPGALFAMWWRAFCRSMLKRAVGAP